MRQFDAREMRGRFAGQVRKFIWINVGVFIMALGLYIFLMPAELAVGGVTGIAMVMQHFFKYVNIGILMIGLNLILFVVAFLVLGFEFGGYTIYCSFLLSSMLGIFEKFFPISQAIVDDLFLNLAFGIVIQGIGMAIIFYQNASTGGTDILAKIVNRFSGLGIGKALFLSDALVTLAAGLTFGPKLGLYAFLGILINALVIDKVIAGFETKIHTLIISERSDAITAYIHDVLNRGTTFISGTGGYTHLDKRIISVVLNRKEYMALKHFMKEVDPNAFIVMNFVHEVIGEGFENSFGKVV